MHSFRITPLRLAAALGVGSLALAGVAQAAGLTVLSKQLFASTQTLTTGTCNQTFTTADDTYVQQASPASTAGGTAGTLNRRRRRLAEQRIHPLRHQRLRLA